MDKTKKVQEELSILEAVDMLSSMAEIDTVVGKEEKLPEDFTGAALETSSARWLNPKEQEHNRTLVKDTFRVIHNYLKNMVETNEEQLKDPETQKGIHAIMVLAGEAAHKVDKFAGLFKQSHDAPSVIQLKEYKELQEFFLQKIMHKVQATLEKEEAWIAEWGAFEPSVVEVEKRGLKDLETVRKDKDYELFFLHKEDGKPFFNRNLLRHIKLVGNFDAAISDFKGEDPLLKIKFIQDRQRHHQAVYLLRALTPALTEFFTEAMRHKDQLLVSSLIKASMALMLASNPQNMVENASGKSSMHYFADFQSYLRTAFESPEYRKLLAFQPKSSDRFSHSVLQMAHQLCRLLFTSPVQTKDSMEFIDKIIVRGEQAFPRMPHSKIAASLWSSLLEDEERMRFVLKHYPNGPLLKTLDSFREGEEKQGFDPLMQDNDPHLFYNFSDDEMHVSVLRLPCPIHQEWINKAILAPEFLGFLRSADPTGVTTRHLMVNLQDRTSWQEHARCQVLETLAEEPGFTDKFFLLTLPKHTEFYQQSGPYHNLQQSNDFLTTFREQIKSGAECGFSFPAGLSTNRILEFTDRAFTGIHKCFFADKNVLTRKDRLDFIEIFYQYLVFFCLKEIKPQTMSFTCKDAVDVGPCASAVFFTFLRVLSNGSGWNDKEGEFLRWMFFAPAILIRDRSVDAQTFGRAVSAGSHIHSEIELQRKEIEEMTRDLLEIKDLKQLKIDIE